ncbi:hypothetical protein DAEQUDRAFT_765118 [Daedalea quercina L-15889]|uniref:Uncharacterized protein n=1 Tax=Daedalea quercina L-15889 TaxID=1314783 RepID=A0A165QQJ7_9APHY|nr:hypothetical protein DAEQUDRAFT_765118 [Daedalea quercina L-15889]
MSVASPTVLPRSPLFPTLLPRPPQPHPTPLQKYGRPGPINRRRNLQQEMDDLSDEEDELDDLEADIRNRGFNFLVPIGRMFTQHEEKNDASGGEASDDSEDSEHSDEDEVSAMDDENDSEPEEDLDADMEDMDEEAGNITGETFGANEDILEDSEDEDSEDYEDDD